MPLFSSLSIKIKKEIKGMPAFHKLKWIEVAAFFGILYFVFCLLAVMLFFYSFLLFVIFCSLSQVALMLFFSGFVVLGVKYNKILIKASSWAVIGLNFLCFFTFLFLVSFPEIFLGLFGFSFDGFYPKVGRSEVVSSDEFMAEMFSALFVAYAEIYVSAYKIIVSFLYFWLALLAAGVCFGIGLIDLAGHIKMARLTGVLMIVGSVLSIVGIGVLALFFAIALGIFVLLNESREGGGAEVV